MNAAIPSSVMERAFEWQVTLWSGEVTAQGREDFARWLAADALHARAWQDVERIGGLIDGARATLPIGSGSRVLRTTGRRRVLRAVAGLGAGGLLAALLSETSQWQTATADHTTRTGERRDLTLSDGTRIALNTATAIDVRITAHERRIVVRRGEIQIETAHDTAAPKRPFLVETRAGTLRALGTRFVVTDVAQAQVLAVHEGAVEVRPRAGDAARRVDAGEQVVFDRRAVGPARQVDPLATAWTRGLLVAERARLADFLERLARHRPGVLRCEPAVADLRVSGVYPLADTDAVLAALAAALPVRVRRITPYWTVVESPA